MKLKFEFGYFHILQWLVWYKENPKIGTQWKTLRTMYDNYWRLDIHKNLSKPAAKDLLKALKKL